MKIPHPSAIDLLTPLAPLPGGTDHTTFSRSRMRAHLLAAITTLLTVTPAMAQPTIARTYPLVTAEGVILHNVSASPVTHAGKRGLRIAATDEVRQRDAMLPLNQQAQFETLAMLPGSDFGDGVIEAELSGTPAAGAAAGARGFVGIAFHVQPDRRTYDAFYLRPTNGRATDQERRNHAAQYIAHPDWPWDRLRRETPSRYEAYVDLVPDVWTKVRIAVRGDTARLYVHDQAQPTLIVNDLKSGRGARGAVALWINPGTVAHFRNVRVHPGR